MQKEWNYYVDQLTLLPNRFALFEYIQQNDKQKNLFVINIDNFSNINKLYGHSIADTLLQEIAKYLQTLGLSHMRLFRFDGDEFVFVSCEYMSIAELEEFAQSLISFFNQIEFDVSFENEITNIKISLSVGIALGSKLEILSYAQLALYEARLHTKGSYKLYLDHSLFIKKQKENIYWINKIKEAVEEERLIAYFQPIYDIQTNTIQKYECLARIKENDTIITPYVFMEAVKISGNYPLITRTIIKKAFEEFSQNNYTFSINITASDMQLGYLEEFLMMQVKKFSVAPNRVILELLEDIVSLSQDVILEQIQRLRALGFLIAIDDFGMEYSNFSRLLEIQPDFLKIDGVFIKDIVENRRNQIIVEAIVDIAKKSNIAIVAEYVANEEIFEYIKKIGINYAQGYFIAQPLEKVF